MWKYFIIILKLGYYLIYKTPGIFIRYFRRNKYSKEYRYNYCRKILLKISKAFNVKYHIEGIENIPSNQTFVLYPNHQSNYDPLALISIIDQPIHFIGKIEVKKMPYIGRFFTIINSIYLDRDDIRSSIKTMRECQKRIEEQKDNFVIFPEGTRTRKEDHRMNEFKAGAFKPATASSSLVIPVVINGTYEVLDKNVRRKQYDVHIKFLKPITPEEYKDLSTIDLSNHVQKIIANELEKLLKNDVKE